MAELGQVVLSAAFTEEEKQRIAKVLNTAVVHNEGAPVEEQAKPKRTKRAVVD